MLKSEIVEAKAPWAALVGYSRAKRRGSLIEVGGTTAVDPLGDVVHPESAYEQAIYVFRIVLDAVGELGGSIEDVIRTRVFLRDIDDWQEVGRAHLEFFGDTMPTSSFVGGAELLHPDLRLEVELTAVCA